MKKIFLFLLLGACGGANWVAPDDFVYMPVKTDSYEIATWQKINNPKNKNIHIYIEGDGHSFDAYGQPTSDPTPRGTFVRDLAVADDFENVVYMARACQFIMDDNCVEADWTSGRFSKKIIDAQSSAIKQIAKDNKITLIGYSGGAMVSGLVIKQNPDLKVVKWITIAGVLNHEKWSQYHKDKPLDKSLNMEKLPKVPQTHFVGGKDENVPYALAKTWADEKDIIIIKSATHDGFEKFGCDILNSL
ncbi:MAG: hypothetical protein J6W08_01200 [Alphaproteobacteria bacterium]|nr:hypothetical protein [Alphaproteobacteria bacterium]